MLSELFILFLSSFISATLFPGGSELLLIYYIKEAPQDSWLYWLSASAGNSLGAVITYIMGYYFNFGRETTAIKYPKAWQYSRRYGVVVLLFSWLPIIGDFLPLAAGWLRFPFLLSGCAIIVGKALRYWLIVSSTLYLLPNLTA